MPLKKESQELISIFEYVTPSFYVYSLAFSRVLLCFNKEGRFNDSEEKHEAIKKIQKKAMDIHVQDIPLSIDASISFVFVVSTLIYFSRMSINVGESRLILF